MNSLFQAASDIQQAMKSRKWPFCFIGGLAVMRWGEIRMTQDIDYIIKQLTPLCELKESPEIVEKLKKIIADNI